ncbi:MAG: pentapeptide repeat-containing protein [Verrucomicrobiaceae bacterium]|nr:MAG: pentapeptide repeat-containing protein [Verrucomicrobiaceae bacterium]
MDKALLRRFVDDADLRHQNFNGAILEGASCMYARFDGSSFVGTDLYWIMAIGSSFRDCDLTDAVLRGGNLKQTTFTGARLVQTDFSRDNLGGSTRLQGADLSSAEIEDCRFDGAEYDFATRFPEGFTPEKHGLSLQPQS